MSETNYFHTDQFQLEGSGFKNTRKKIFEGTEKMWKSFFETGLILTTPVISAYFSWCFCKNKNAQSAQITSNILISLTGGKISPLTDIHGNRLRLKV